MQQIGQHMEMKRSVLHEHLRYPLFCDIIDSDLSEFIHHCIVCTSDMGDTKLYDSS